MLSIVSHLVFCILLKKPALFGELLFKYYHSLECNLFKYLFSYGYVFISLNGNKVSFILTIFITLKGN